MSTSSPAPQPGPRPTAYIEVTADNPGIEIRLLDSDREVRAHGVGELKQEVRPGLYELQFSAGPSTRSELIALRAGEKVVRNAHVDFPSPAPIGGSGSTGGAAQRAALEELARRMPSEAPGEGAGELVVFLRKVSSETAAIEADAFDPLALIDENENMVSALEGKEELQHDEQGGEWAAACRKLKPGSYALRLEPGASHPADHPAGQVVRRAFDQSVCIEGGWRTLVFVPSVASGPVPQIASIHMTRAGGRWNPSSPSTLALETMLAYLRDGKGVVSARHLDLVISEEATNPMLGVVTAHSALLADPPDFGLFDRVVSYLVEKWPAFPDVRALHPIGEERRRYRERRERLGRGERYEEPPPPKRATPPVTWPPMLLASYQGLIACDAKWPELQLIGEGSLAERAAIRLLVGGIWSAWEPMDRETETDKALRELDRAEQPTRFGKAFDYVCTGALRLLRHSVTARDWRQTIANRPTDDPVTIRIKQYLTALADRSEAKTVQEFVAGLNVQTISQATGLPAGVIRPKLERVKALVRETDWS